MNHGLVIVFAHKCSYSNMLNKLLALARIVLSTRHVQTREAKNSRPGTTRRPRLPIGGFRTVSGTISTESRIKMLFLTLVGGHKLSFRVRRPQAVVAGVILYQTTWVLLPGA